MNYDSWKLSSRDDYVTEFEYPFSGVIVVSAKNQEEADEIMADNAMDLAIEEIRKGDFEY